MKRKNFIQSLFGFSLIGMIPYNNFEIKADDKDAISYNVIDTRTDKVVPLVTSFSKTLSLNSGEKTEIEVIDSRLIVYIKDGKWQYKTKILKGNHYILIDKRTNERVA